MMAALLEKLRHHRTEPLEPLTPTSDILADIDMQVGRLQVIRERALELIERIEEP